MGPFGWLGLDFTARKKVDWDEVRELVDASFRLIAPKKLIRQLDEALTRSAVAMVRSGP